MPKLITKTLSVRLSLMVVSAISILLMASLAVMFYYARKAVKEEVLEDSRQTLEGTIQQIDNILLSVEQASGNIYFNLFPHLYEPDKMLNFSRRLVESNPNIAGCAIAFKPYFYKDCEHFMAYMCRVNRESDTDTIIRKETFADAPYTQQEWYTMPMHTGKVGWIDPLKEVDADSDPIITFCLPIMNIKGERIGVMGVDVSLYQLSKAVLSNKTLNHSYCMLLGSKGEFIIHPDSAKLFHKTIFSEIGRSMDSSLVETAEAMVAGETGYRTFCQDGQDFYIFYKPFLPSNALRRLMGKLNWSIGVVYSEDEIFGEYNHLLYYVLMISIVGLLLLFVLCRTITHRRLRPLLLLTRSVQHIAEGNYDDTIPDSKQQDEIGRLQNDFQQMQHSLKSHVSELQQLTETLKERGERLNKAYQQALESDRMKTAFLHNMTNKMVEPAMTITQDVDTLCNFDEEMDQEERNLLVKRIQDQSDTITRLLGNMLDASLEKGDEKRSDLFDDQSTNHKATCIF